VDKACSHIFAKQSKPARLFWKLKLTKHSTTPFYTWSCNGLSNVSFFTKKKGAMDAQFVASRFYAGPTE
jgi:hypothetical protein